MGDANGRLGEGNADSAVDLQGARWKRCARARRAWRKPCSRVTATSRATAPATQRPPAGRGQLDRSARTADAPQRIHRRLTVKIPGEIDVQRVRRILEELRRRLADPARPQIELDYIERLLKDY